jgi:neutral ceramidase
LICRWPKPRLQARDHHLHQVPRVQTSHCKNNLRRQGSFPRVQRWTGLAWSTVADISWTIPAGTPAGTYRVMHLGDARNLLGRITPFTGVTRSFQVAATR